MVNAWNKTPEIRKDLSKKITACHFSNPIEKIYNPGRNSKVMSQAMTEFWKEHPDHANTIGQAIASSMDEYDTAQKKNEEEEFTRKVFEEQKEIIAQFQEYKESIQEFTARSVALKIAGELPYFPTTALYELGEFDAKYMWANLEADWSKFYEERPAFKTQTMTAQLKEIVNCAKDEQTKEILLDWIKDSEELQKITSRLGDDILEFNFTAKNDASYRVRFKRLPNADTIDKYYLEYRTPLTSKERREIIEILRKNLEKGSIKRKNINFTFIDNILKEYGGVAREIFSEDIAIKNSVLLKMLNHYCYLELSRIGQEYEDLGKEEEFIDILQKSETIFNSLNSDLNILKF